MITFTYFDINGTKDLRSGSFDVRVLRCIPVIGVQQRSAVRTNLRDHLEVVHKGVIIRCPYEFCPNTFEGQILARM